MIHYVCVKVSDLERAGRFYDSILNPLGWRRQEEGATTISWGLQYAHFFITLDEATRPGYGIVSFPAKSIPAVKAAFESGTANGGRPEAEPGAAPAFGSGNYCCRMYDPDGYLVELVVAP